ncbi:hypothetical protein GEMRC1_000036 [Eukaryota sp. GEM-RC1]
MLIEERLDRLIERGGGIISPTTNLSDPLRLCKLGHTACFHYTSSLNNNHICRMKCSSEKHTHSALRDPVEAALKGILSPE